MQSISLAAVTCLSLEKGQGEGREGSRTTRQMATPGEPAPAPDLCAEVEAIAQKAICLVGGAGRGVLVNAVGFTLNAVNPMWVPAGGEESREVGN